MKAEDKKSIDKMSYESMLSLWRFAPAGHPMFQGDTGEYYSKVMQEKREQIGNKAHVATSKSIGFGG